MVRYLFAVALLTQLVGCPSDGATTVEDEAPEGTISLEEALESVEDETDETQEGSAVAVEAETQEGVE